MPILLACPDKFKGTLSAPAAAAAVARAARRSGWEALEVPLADGGDGTLAALGGGNRVSTVTGPTGDPVEAAWRLDGGLAVVESAEACGLVRAGGPEGNDPIGATSRGVGELVAAAVAAGARTVLVGVGGVAGTDGGAGAVEALRTAGVPTPGGDVEVQVLCDVAVRFVEAATAFGPQKGATPGQVAELRRRLVTMVEASPALAAVADRPGSGAGGGLAGALAAWGAELADGAGHVAAHLHLDAHLERCDLVVTGEGQLDATSFDGKVVGHVAALARRRGRRAWAVVGREEIGGMAPLERVLSLVERCGEARAWAEPAACLEEVVGRALAEASAGGAPDAGEDRGCPAIAADGGPTRRSCR